MRPRIRCAEVYQTTLVQSVDLPISACQRAAKTRSAIAWGTVAGRQERPGDLSSRTLPLTCRLLHLSKGAIHASYGRINSLDCNRRHPVAVHGLISRHFTA